MLSDVTSPFFKPISVRMPPNSQSQQTQLKKDISKLPEKSQKEHYLFKTAPSEGNRANVGTGRETAGEPALRSSPTRSVPHCMSEGDRHHQQPCPHTSITCLYTRLPGATFSLASAHPHVPPLRPESLLCSSRLSPSKAGPPPPPTGCSP